MTATPTSVKVALLDIEGTVCPISFVKDVLFPYALRALPDTLETEWDSPEFAEYKNAFPPEHAASRGALLAHVQDLMAQDLKIAYLKSLQGYLWQRGYANGEIRAPLFPDVPAKLKTWTDNGVKVMIYSSGSVPAQKLLFKHTSSSPPDLTPLISDWFDTVNAGLKQNKTSYETIAAKHPGVAIGEWLFLSDNVQEVDAAIAAGMRSLVVQRPGNAALPTQVIEQYPVIESFDLLDDQTLTVHHAAVLT
ncbi:enolase-phosphatase E1 [Microdochium bolleyi]|uniref:Enolase-phosphatase E1 n=1 Tax=Microdochium bolleyi TaxID=196109 RepID=A0A136JB08_9PEZI|nr:enolase-phosphatase E1 [Microdochium bolleyi]